MAKQNFDLDIVPETTHANLSMNPKGRPNKQVKSNNKVMVYFTDEELEKLEIYAAKRGGKSVAIKSVLADQGII